MDRLFRQTLSFFRQRPWIWPAGVIASAQRYVETENAHRSWFQRRRGAWYRPMHPAAVRISRPPQNADGGLPLPFHAEAARTIPETGLYYLPGAYLFSDQGAVLSRDNQIFDEFAHHFDTVPLRSGAYFRPFATFVRNVDRYSGWVALLAAPEGRNYYHWLFDVLPRLALLESMRAHIERYALPASLNSVQQECLTHLGITPPQILSLQPGAKLFCERLLVPSLPGSEGSVPDWSVHFLRQAFLPAHSDGSNSSPRTKIYLSRRDTRTRPILNEDQLIQLLRARGFEIVIPDRLSFHEQVYTFAEAKIVIGAHGASLSNLVFSDHASVLEIFSPQYLRPDCYYTLADQCEHRYWYLVGRLPAGVTGAPWGSVEVPLDALQRLLDAIESTAAL